MMRITTLCSAFILSILSLSLFAQESVDPSPLPTDSLQPAPEAIKPAKTVKSSTVVDSTDFIRIFPVYILVYMNRINYMYKGTGKNI